VDFAGPYLYATIVCLTLKNSKYAAAKGISDLSGGSCTSQLGTIWYDTCLPQIQGAKIQTAAESAPAMLMALETGTVDFICTDMPTAQGAVIAYPDMTILDFSGSSDDFKVSDEDVEHRHLRHEGQHLPQGRPQQRAVQDDRRRLQQADGPGDGHPAREPGLRTANKI
jgi:hypothetical protein